MAKIRIHELAKELNLDAKDIIAYLGGDLKAVSGIEEEDAARVKNHFKPAAPKPEVKKAEKPVQKAPSADRPAEKKEDAPKKKKPVLLFRPENSKIAGKKPLQNPNAGRPRPQGSGNAPSRPADTGSNERRVIKPHVATTAESYKQHASDGRRKIEDTTDAVKKLKRDEELRAEEAAKIAREEAERLAREEAERKAAEEAAAKKAAEEQERAAKEAELARLSELAAKEEAERKMKAEAEKAAAEALKNTETKKEDKLTEKTEKKPAEKSDMKKKPAENTQKTGQKQGQKQAIKPIEKATVKVLDRIVITKPEDKKKPKLVMSQYAKRDGQNQGQRQGSNRSGQQTGRPGQPGTRPNNGQGQGQGQRQGGRNGQNPQSNRGVFSSNNRTGNANVRYNPDNSGAATLTKADARGNKKANSSKQNDRSRSNYDRNGKNTENFKNLSRDQSRKTVKKQEEEVIKMISLPDVITVGELAARMHIKAADIIKKQFLAGNMCTMNTELSYEQAEAIALEYDVLCEQEEKVDVIEELLKEDAEDEAKMVKRPPVVCVMGHVDHGKTSLLDAIRSTHVTDREAGGITQHIGAYMVECNGEPITFLDTPGHEAFTAMRMRGAQATDIAVLVVAADDGVMPQTVEAINHAKAAGVDIIVAVNKIDKPAANVDRVKQELTEYGLIAEDWGGDTVFVPVSAKTHENIDQLLEMILLVTEVKELKANPNREMRGIVIEAKLDKGRGPVATVLVQKGTLKVGDFVSCGSFYGRVRAMLDADGNQLKKATPSMPCEILGLNGVPMAGEVCVGHKNEKDARAYAETFIAEEKKKMLAETKKRLTMDSLFAEIKAGNVKELPIVVKADVQGSVEAVRSSLEKLTNEEVAVKVIHGGVGAINESDVSLASASNAIIIGFNVKPDNQAKILADAENVELKLYRVIYQAIDDVEAAMKGMQAPKYEEKVLGHAEVRQLFKASAIGTIAGSYILDGTFERGCDVRVMRGKDQIYDGPLASLKRFKDDVKEVREGFECGIVLEKFNDIQEGDIIEAYKMVQVEVK